MPRLLGAIVLRHDETLRLHAAPKRLVIERRRKTKRRGPIALAYKDMIVGIAILAGVERDGDGYKWILECPTPLPRPLRFERRRGQSLWARIPQDVRDNLEPGVRRLLSNCRRGLLA